MDQIKEAFQKIKEDMYSLQYQLDQLRLELDLVNSSLSNVLEHQTNIQTDKQHLDSVLFQLNMLKDQFAQLIQQTNQQKTQSINQINSSNNDASTQTPAVKQASKGLLTSFNDTSTGNEGVPTNSQTIKQTDNSTGNEGVQFALMSKEYLIRTSKPGPSKVAELINSLDEVKKDIRTRVKKLTNQEMTVFSAIYELENKGFLVDYPLLAESLKLTESSIRDYTQRIIKKGLPLEKYKENNKKVLLTISADFKKLSNLQTLLQLREL